MKLSASLLLVALGLVGTARATAVEVTNGNDNGSGSLREALEAGATSITFANGFATVNIASTLLYAGDGPLTIQGRKNLKIAADGDFTLLEISEGADLTVKEVSFRGIGGFGALAPLAQGDGKGIFVKVPTSSTKTVVKVDLEDVTVSDVAYHGIHVSDCDLNPCGNGSGGGGDGSDASISVMLKDVTVLDVGYGGFDGDGVRVDERGNGDIIFEAEGSSFKGCGADGVELDEGDEGDVRATVRNSVFIENGSFCDLDIDVARIEAPDCIEDDELDLDDGFDIDEAGPGSLYVTVSDSVASDNTDEGFDFDEAGDGDIDATFTSVKANDNLNEGIKCSEEDDGDVMVTITDSFVNGNQDDGMQLESENDGTIHVVIENTKCNGSRKSDLKVEQPDAPSPLGTLTIDTASKIGCVETDNNVEVMSDVEVVICD